MANTLRPVLVVVGMLAGMLLFPSVATAGVGASAAPEFPITIRLGDTDVPAAIEVRNSNSDDPDPADPGQDTGYTNTVCNEGDGFPCTPGERGITLVPSCGLIGVSTTCDPNGADPGVFGLSPTATGSGACAGIDFTVAIIDATIGMWQFTPTLGRNVTLPGTGAQCEISFTFDVLKLPTVDVNPNVGGVQTAQIVSTDQIVEAASDNHVVPAEGNGTSVRQVLLAQPTIATTASADTRLAAGDLTDTAVVSGRFDPDASGTIDFRLYGPDDTTCSGTPVFESLDVAQPAADGPITSEPFTPTLPGRYRWTASYSGDTKNLPVAGACNDATEITDVDKALPVLVTEASADATIDSATLTDTATVSGRFSPQASTIDFRLYGPDDATCSGTPVFESLGVVYPIVGGSVTSASFTPATPGTYRWIATYAGDDTNEAVTGTCDDPTETTAVTRVTPTLATTASGSVVVDTGTLVDTAVVTGRHAPAASTVDFRLYGPGDATCSAAPVFESLGVEYPIAGGPVSSAAFSPTAIGTYRWVATYSGDVNNEPVTGACGDAAETTVVTGGTPTLTASDSPDITLGAGSLSATTTVLGRVGSAPGGTVDFKLYGPGDATCAEPVVFEALGVAATAGQISSGPFTPTAAGTYRWTVSYSGDAKNAAIAAVCNEPVLSTVVAPAISNVTVKASPQIELGAGTLTATASVTARVNAVAGGTVRFRLYGPGDDTCSRPAIFTTSASAYSAAGGPMTSAAFTPKAAGTYRWQAFYSGDANNASVASSCALSSAAVTVTAVSALELPATGTATTRTLGMATGFMLLGVALLTATRRRRFI